jgi:hypothetical protein
MSLTRRGGSPLDQNMGMPGRSAGAYDALCGWIDSNGGKVRLGRTNGCFTLVVDAPAEAHTHRVAGYAFGDIAELDSHALLILRWLETTTAASDPTA